MVSWEGVEGGSKENYEQHSTGMFIQSWRGGQSTIWALWLLSIMHTRGTKVIKNNAILETLHLYESDDRRISEQQLIRNDKHARQFESTFV